MAAGGRGGGRRPAASSSSSSCHGQTWSQTDGGLCRLQDMQREWCSTVSRVQGYWQEQEERQHFREMEVLRLPMVWAQELSQLWQGRPHTRAERRTMRQLSCTVNPYVMDRWQPIQTVAATLRNFGHLLSL